MANARTRGFVTIATGDHWYYTIALALLRSYRSFSKAPLPFAIIAEEENEITKQFDRVILIDAPTRSYVDKLRLGAYLPFDETIFIDADCLAYSDLDVLFDIFKGASDVSCLGITEPLTDKTNGWFSLLSFPRSSPDDEDVITREAAKTILPYAVGLHGGMLYMRNTDLTRKVFSDALKFAGSYSKYRFHMFRRPADEPVIALSMAMNHCRPIPYDSFALTCFWCSKALTLDMYKGKAYRSDRTPIPLLHWGSRNTKTPIYKKQVDQLDMRIDNVSGPAVFMKDLANSIRILFFRIRRKLRRIFK